MKDSKSSADFGEHVPLRHIWTAGIPFEGPIDIDYLIDIPNASVALRALEFLSDLNNELVLRQRHSPAELARAWRGVFRGLLAHGLEVPAHLRGYAARLGVVLVE